MFANIIAIRNKFKQQFQYEYTGRSHPSKILHNEEEFYINIHREIRTKAGFVQIYETKDESKEKKSLAVKFILASQLRFAEMEIKQNEKILNGLLYGNPKHDLHCNDVLLELLYVDIVKSERYIMLIFEGFPSDLFQVIFADEDLPDYSEVMTLLKDITIALRCLEDFNLVYGDLKPDNILVSKENRYILADFDTLQDADEHGKADAKGTKGFLSLERLLGKKASSSDDVWSLSVVLYMFITKEKSLWNTKVDFIQVVQDKAVEEIRENTEHWESQDVEHLIELFLTMNSYFEATRITLEDLFQMVNNPKHHRTL